jgi:signal peptidase II
MKFSKRLILISSVLIFCVGCDQATKSIAVSHLPAMKTFSYLGDTLRLQLSYNRGAFLSMGHSLPDFLRHSIFTVGTCFILLGGLIFALSSKSSTFYMILAISLFIAGGVGNLIDRILRDGTVVDFLNVGIGPLRTGIFNIADVAIMGGAALLFFTTLRKQKENRKPKL